MTKRFGPQPRNVVALHLCGHTWCVRPSHIVPGRRRGRSTLTVDQVGKIRHLAADGTLSRKQIARAFGVDQQTVFDIFTPAGAFLGSASVPAHVGTFALAGSYLVTGGEDGAGVPLVTLWRVR